MATVSYSDPYLVQMPTAYDILWFMLLGQEVCDDGAENFLIDLTHLGPTSSLYSGLSSSGREKCHTETTRRDVLEIKGPSAKGDVLVHVLLWVMGKTSETLSL